MPETPTAQPYINFESALKDNPVSSGFDMKPTLAWVENNKDILSHKLDQKISASTPSRFPEEIQPADNSELNPELARSLLGLIPDDLRLLSQCDKILGNESLWFKKTDTDGEIEVTTDISQAISETAIASGGTTDQINPPALTVMVCKIPETVVPDATVRKIISSTTIIHEFFHTITWAMLKDPNILIELPDGQTVSGRDYILSTFGETAKQHGPITHYSRGYRDEQNEFLEREGKTELAIEEEFVETLTTMTLGFACGSLTDISRDPLADRPRIKEVTTNFLQSKKASKPEDTGIDIDKAA